MYRNDSNQKITKQIPFSPQSSMYNKSSQLFIKPIQSPNQYIQLEKTRTFSHKKLTITSAPPSPISNDTIKKIITPSFQINKFYRPPTRGNLMMQSKKNNFQQSKVSLRLSNVGNIQIKSPSRMKQNNTNQNIMYLKQVNNCISQRQGIKNQLKQILNSKIMVFQHQIIEQSNFINILKQKIELLQGQLNNKTQIINYLLSQKNNINTKTQSTNQFQSINLRLADVQKIMPIISKQTNNSQQAINCKIDELTKKLVQMKLNSQAKELGQLKNNIQKINNKMYQLLNKQNQKLQKIQKYQTQIIENTSMKVQNGIKNIHTLVQKIRKIQENANKKKQYNEKITQTQDSINYWETFEDYVLTNRSQNQIKNISIFGQDDYFFHPQHKLPTFNVLRSSISSIPSTYNSYANQNHQITPTATQNMPLPSKKYQQKQPQQSTLSNLLNLMQHLKTNYNSQLPLKCKIDKHGRIILWQNNKIIQNQQTKLFYKINQEQKKILINRCYLDIEDK